MSVLTSMGPLARWHCLLPTLMLVIQVAMTTPDDDIIVRTSKGSLRGKRTHHSHHHLRGAVITNTIDTFLGVPYAKPPLGQLRFRPPMPVEPWEGIRNATTHGKVCFQLDIFNPGTRKEFQNEDCLFVNIFTPYQTDNPDARYPVMLYIHGGSFEVGSGNLYDGSVLAGFGVVVVTVNYRLGALGFLTSADHHIPGNSGLLDQIQALQWIHDHIQSFRGDPGRVTIIGHSAGGASIGLLLVVPRARNLVHQAIGQSGSAVASYCVHRNKSKMAPHGVDFRWYLSSVAEIFDCPDGTTEEIANCLRNVPAQKFIDQRMKFPLFDPIDPEFRPFVDGNVLPDTPRNMYNQGDFNHVPLMVGTVRDEFGNYFNGGERSNPTFDTALDNYLHKSVREDLITDVVRFEYTNFTHPRNESPVYDRGALLSDMHMVAPTVDMATLASRHNPNIYQYHFSTDDCYHSAELNFVFGAPFSGKFADEMNTEDSNKTFTRREKKLSILVMKLWSNFAKNGTPIPDSSDLNDLSWPRFDAKEKAYLSLNPHEPSVKYSLREDKVAFWNDLLPKLKEGIKPRDDDNDDDNDDEDDSDDVNDDDTDDLNDNDDVNNDDSDDDSNNHGPAYGHQSPSDLRPNDEDSLHIGASKSYVTENSMTNYRAGMWIFVATTIVLMALLMLVLFLFIKTVMENKKYRQCLRTYDPTVEIRPTKV